MCVCDIVRLLVEHNRLTLLPPPVHADSDHCFARFNHPIHSVVGQWSHMTGEAQSKMLTDYFRVVSDVIAQVMQRCTSEECGEDSKKRFHLVFNPKNSGVHVNLLLGQF